MTESSQRKRPRVTTDILGFPFHPKATSTPELNLVQQERNQELIKELKRENAELQNKFKAERSTFELKTQLKADLIEELAAKKAEAEMRSVYHMKRSKEAADELTKVTSENKQLKEDMEAQQKMLRSEIDDLKIALNTQVDKHTHLLKEKELVEKENEDKISRLSSMFDHANELLKEKTEILEKVQDNNKDLVSTISELEERLENITYASESPNNYHRLERQFLSVCEENKTLVSKNKEITRQLRHYTEVAKEIEQFDDETMTIQERLAKTSQINNENKQLVCEISALKAEKEAWRVYLKNHVDAPFDDPAIVIRSLTKKAEEAEGVTIMNKRLQESFNDTQKLVDNLETHVKDLKKKVMEYEGKYNAALAAKSHVPLSEKTMMSRIELLQGHLDYYEHEEKKYMAATYDEKKSARIAELEGLLTQFQESIKQQDAEISSLKLNVAVPTIIPNGPYDELYSGKTIVELLSKMIKKNESYYKDFAQKMAEYNILKKDLQIKEGESYKGRILALLANPDSTKRAARIDALKKLEEENRLLLENQLSTVKDEESYISLPKLSITSLQNNIQELKAALESKDKRINRLFESWKKKSDMINETIQHVFGYKVAFRDDGMSSLESNYVEGRRLRFYVNLNGESDETRVRITGLDKDNYVQMLLRDVYETYIKQDKNISAFFNAAGLELYVQYKQRTGVEPELIKE